MGADTFLTSLANIKQWLGINNDNSDALLTRMNRSCSAFVLNHLNRDSLSLTQYRDIYDGYGNCFMVLRHSPVFEVQAVSFNGTSIPQATGDGFSSPYSNGWSLEPEYSVLGSGRLNLYGWVFPRGRGLVAVQCRAGYVAVDEPWTIPATPFQITVLNFWLGDVSVKSVDGATFTKVTSSPAAGQYSVADGVYTFNATDEETEILISYSYTPADIEQAVIEIVGERYRTMDRIGVLSKALGGQETVSFSQKDMSSYVKSNLTPFVNVTPI